jgi:hypothetical protein
MAFPSGRPKYADTHHGMDKNRIAPFLFQKNAVFFPSMHPMPVLICHHVPVDSNIGIPRLYGQTILIAGAV